ncbi:MAG: ABC transporter substrate-binding protein [Coriobacteriia bacterium]|nr:ABC transporter substrate-binding protein [Coriobacteriia bacterium]
MKATRTYRGQKKHKGEKFGGRPTGRLAARPVGRLALVFSILALALLFGAGLSACTGGGTDNGAQTAADTSTADASSGTSADAGTSSTAATGPITVTDMSGQVVTLDGPATSVVAIQPSDCEIIYALGAGDTLVGRGTYCNYPDAVNDVPVVESGSDMNAEQILALDPQVVIISPMAQSGEMEQAKILTDAGIKVVVDDANTIDETYDSINLLGAVLGKDAEAQALVDSMKTSFADIQSKSTGDGTRTIYFEVSPLAYGLWTAGSGTFLDEIAHMLGLTNAFADVSGWAQISEEQVIERNPDYIVTVAMDYGDNGPGTVTEILNRTGWGDMKAIKAGAVFDEDPDSAARPGPRLVDAAEGLYNFVYVDMAGY